MNTKHRLTFILFISTAFSIFYGCKQEDEKRLQANWSAKDPIAIPHNVRNNEQQLGNIVVNPSFETGKIYYEDSNIKSFDIDGWKKLGQNITWVNANNGDYNASDVYEGSHAIKIERNIADETEEEGDGIISDYIKVIPGNYSLKLFLKLEKICPNKSRIGTKMFDAINIRMHYYDKNKIEISPIEYDPFSKKKIDNGFKALNLANFWSVDQFGWGEIHGKTALYPYFDGDLPDETKYVKIFIGLKGTGKMWIDKVDFRYTNENFTMLERLKPYFDSSYAVSDMIFPHPRSIVKNEIFSYYEKGLYPIIVLPQDASEQIKNAVNDFKEHLILRIKSGKDSLSPEVNIVNYIDVNDLKPNQMIISVGKNQLYHAIKQVAFDSLLTKNENSYGIFQHDSVKNLVLVHANNDESTINALHTLIQLFDAQNANYYNANIIDYPDYKERAMVLHHFNGDVSDLNNKIAYLNQSGLNKLYFEYNGSNWNNNYPFKSIEELSTNNEYIDYGVLMDQMKINAHSNSSNSYKDVISRSVKSVLIGGDYYQPYDECNTEKIAYISGKDINNKLQDDHAELLNEVDQFIHQRNISANIEFIPPWNRLDIIDKGQGQAEFYYHDLSRNISRDIVMYWTGGTYYSSSIDMIQYDRMKNISGTNPLLFDNSLIESEKRFNDVDIRNYYAGKLRTLSLFEPYNLNAFSDFYKANNHRKIVLNTTELTELNTIRILTALDYYWNTQSYSPDKSLWIVLNKLYGRENTIKLLQFNDAYYGLCEICQKIEIHGSQFKNMRIAKNFMTELTQNFEALQVSVNNKQLMNELEDLKTNVEAKYNDLTASVK